MGGDGTRTPEELTATAAASGAGARKEGACAARRLFRPGVPRPLPGPAHYLGWPWRCLKDWRLPATASSDCPVDTGTWELQVGASALSCFVSKWSSLRLVRLIRNTLLLFHR